MLLRNGSQKSNPEDALLLGTWDPPIINPTPRFDTYPMLLTIGLKSQNNVPSKTLKLEDYG